MLHITQHKKGLKMHGFISINTSCTINPFCKKSCKNEYSICKYCYARNMEYSYPSLKKALIKNYYKLSTPLSDEEIQEISLQIKMENKQTVRFNSLGELSGITNLINYYSIAESLPNHNFALWTKRKNIVRYTNKKPDNMSLIYSNMFIDNPIEKVPAGFDGVFNVVSYEYAIENNIKPNCSGQCITCMKCYTGDRGIVTELLKRDQNSIKKGFLKPLNEV